MKILKIFGLTLLGAAIVWVAIFAIMCFTGAIHFGGYFVRESVAVRALETQGFRNIVIVKRNCSFIGMRGGGDKDDVRFEARALNPIGKEVTVYVFVGWPFKGATVRSP